jgi:peptide deformylase
MIRDVLKWGDPKLTLVSTPIKEIDNDVHLLAQDLVETLRSAGGIGLAAPQIGVNKRMIVVDIHKSRPRVLINPELSNMKSWIDHEEACLSVPGLSAVVSRAADCTLTWTNINGETQVHQLSGFEAIVYQHEIDHLDGVLYVDHLSKLKRDVLRRKFLKSV